ncbi:MAG: PQQ-binding-like beta-propeller repeat protein [Micropepsaceae bacterium]
MNSANRSLRLNLIRTAALAAALALGGCSTINSVTESIFGAKTEARVPGERISLMPRGQDALVQDPVFAGKAVPLPAPVQVGSWPNPGGTPENAVGNIDASVNFGQAWSTSIGVSTSSDSAITASPIIAQGMIFTLDAAVGVRAFDVSSGGEIWGVSLAVEDTSSDWYFFSSGGDTPEEGYGGGLAYSDGRLYVTTGFGEVVALNPNDGSRLWTKKTGSPFHTAPTARDGRVYVVNRENRMWALDGATGGEIWNHEVFAEGAGVLASTSPAAGGDLIVVPYTNGDIYALRANNGRAVWSNSLTRTGVADSLSSINDIAGRPVIDGNIVFAISHAGRFVAIDARSGERLWTRDLAGVQTPWVAGDYVYVTGMDGVVYCFEKLTGRVAWSTYLGRWQDEEAREDTVEWSGPLMANGHLVLTSTDGRIAVLAASSGAVEQSFETGVGSIIAPIAAAGALFLLNDDGDLTAYR